MGLLSLEEFWGRPLHIWISGSAGLRAHLEEAKSEMLKGQLLSGVLRDGELLAASAESLAPANCHLSSLPP